MNGLEAFEIEQLLGIYVYATWVYYLVTFVPPQLPQAMALRVAACFPGRVSS